MSPDWRPIETYPYELVVDGRRVPFSPVTLVANKDRQWVRMGRYYKELRQWYYSGTNERSQYTPRDEGDLPTHWMPLPSIREKPYPWEQLLEPAHEQGSTDDGQ